MVCGYATKLREGCTMLSNIRQRRIGSCMRTLIRKLDFSCFLICLLLVDVINSRKWDGTTMSAMYLAVILRRRDISSIRDLNVSHLPLLKKIRSVTIDAITSKWPEVTADQLRLYFHCTILVDIVDIRSSVILPLAYPCCSHRFEWRRWHGSWKSLASRRYHRTTPLPRS
jgi:Scavenger mRNA decapping enzyme C-term binding